MGKTIEEICNLLIKNYANADAENICSLPKRSKKTLASCVYCSDINYYNPYQALFNDDNLYNPLVRKITTELAIAIDDNNIQKIKYLKNKFGNLEEFKNAREFLNKKCKEVWNVYEPIKNLPKDAMKCLGITNQPGLDFMLSTSLKYYEKDNSENTSHIISSIIKNSNLSYNIDDVHKYLKEMNQKSHCVYNFKTVKYLISKHNYTKDKLKDLGVEKETIKQAVKDLPLLYKLKLFYLT